MTQVLRSFLLVKCSFLFNSYCCCFTSALYFRLHRTSRATGDGPAPPAEKKVEGAKEKDVPKEGMVLKYPEYVVDNDKSSLYPMVGQRMEDNTLKPKYRLMDKNVGWEEHWGGNHWRVVTDQNIQKQLHELVVNNNKPASWAPSWCPSFVKRLSMGVAALIISGLSVVLIVGILLIVCCCCLNCGKGKHKKHHKKHGHHKHKDGKEKKDGKHKKDEEHKDKKHHKHKEHHHKEEVPFIDDEIINMSDEVSASVEKKTEETDENI